jgi:phosphatidylserine decarboxylase
MFGKLFEKLLTVLVYFFAKYHIPLVTPLIILAYVRFYSVNESEAKPWHAYRTLMSLFTRQIDLTQRKKPDQNCLISPCDGFVSDWGRLDYSKSDKSLKIKGRGFCPKELIGEDWLQDVQQGYFFSLYLSPKDYHRFHCPANGLVVDGVRQFHGRLRSVNPKLFKAIPNLLSENERVACRYRTNTGQTVIMVFVGAMIVGSVDLVSYPNGQELKQGDEIGCFNFGSSIVMFVSEGLLGALHLQQSGPIALFDVLGEERNER